MQDSDVGYVRRVRNRRVRIHAVARMWVQAFLCWLATSSMASATIAYVQQANQSVDSASATSMTFSAAESVGDLIVVVAGWTDTTASIQSVSDTLGNTYALAVGPTVSSAGNASLSIYYAKNIAAGSNTVTVTFSKTVSFPDVRVAEYSGVDTVSPFDAGAGNTGTGSALTSGSVTTANANDLLVAGTYLSDVVTAPDPSYTQRAITSGGEILEDKVVSATGSYNATATQGTAAWWVMQQAAFKAGASGDTTPPTTPTGLAATAASSTQINLSWTASTDNVGVVGYRVERCQGASCTAFVQIATPTATSYSDTGLTPSTTYSYRVRATDAAGNLSGYSGTSGATTQSAPDTTPPSVPTGLTATAGSSSQINLSWTASTDNVGVVGYLVERCQGSACTTFTQIATPTGTSFGDTGLSASTPYSYRIRATDAAGNLSGYSSTAGATTAAAGQSSVAYVQQANQSVGSAAATSMTFSAAESAGDLIVVVAGWTDTTASIQSVSDTLGNTYALAVGPTVSSAGNASLSIYYAKNIAAGSNTVTVTFSKTVSWPDVRVAEYSGVDKASPFDAGAANTGTGTGLASGSVTTANANDLLVAGTYLSDAVTASDPGYTQRVITSGGEILEDRVVSATGGYSATAIQGTAAWWIMQQAAFKAASGSDTTPPTAPTGLISPANSSTQLNLTWTASTDNVKVTGYLIERCQGSGCTTFAQVATNTTPSYIDTNVSPSSTYGYRVRATDAIGNLSGYSNTISASTAAAVAHSCPSTAAATACYLYDDAGRLKLVTYADGTNTAYTLDPAGNRRQVDIKPLPPGPPGAPTFTNISQTSVKVSWTAPTTGGPVVSYQYNIGAGWIDVGTALTATLTGLVAGTPYTVTVQALNTGGSAAASNTFNTLKAPGAPSQPIFTNITSTAATATWTAASGSVGSYEYAINGNSWVNVGLNTSANITGLAPASSNTVQVRARDAANNPGPGSTSTLLTLPSSPAAPTFSAITTSSATVSWGAVTGIVASYEYRVNSGSWINVGTARTANLSGLASATSYNVQVHAVNASGPSTPSSASFMTLPSAPGTLSVTNITTTTATVNWPAAAGTIDHYEYSIGSGAWTSVGTALSASLSGLSPGTVYTVQVRAVDLSGPGAASSGGFTTLPGPPGTPSITSITMTTATVSWSAASGPITGYEYRLNSGAWIGVGTALSVNLSSLAAGTLYTVQVHALDVSGAGAASSAQFTTSSVPAAPTGLQSSVTTAGGQFTLTWGTVSGATSYEIFDSTSTPASQVYSGTAASVTLTRPTGFIYKFYALACNGAGCSVPSATLSVTVDCKPVSCL